MMFSERFPGLSLRLKSGFDPNSISAKTHKKVEILCMGNNCENYVEKRPDNMSRVAGEPLIFCNRESCRKEKSALMPKRKVIKGNSIKDKFPTLAKQLISRDPEHISWRDANYYEFKCISCNDTLKISPKKIKENNDAWAPYCEKIDCKNKSKTVKSKICKERGSYEKLAIDESSSFGILYPDIARMQHPTCPLNLNEIKAGSNKKVILSCCSCGAPVGYSLNKTIFHEEFYCEGEKCLQRKKIYFRMRDWKTRIKSRGTFASEHPQRIGEWVRCIDLPQVTPWDIPPNVRLIVEWKCKVNPKHVWLRSVDGRAGCPFCTANVSKMQLRFASELSHFLNIPISHSEVLKISEHRVEVDIPIRLNNVEKFAVEVDGYKWHKDKAKEDSEKDIILKSDGWTVIRIRDDRLQELASTDKTILVPSNGFYKSQWREAIIQVLKYLGLSTPKDYDSYLAQDKYLSLLDYYKLGGG